MNSTESDILGAAFKEIKDITCDQDVKDFTLPPHYFNFATVKINFNEQQNVRKIHCARKELLHEVSSLAEQDFDLPEDYFCLINENANSEETNIENDQNFTGSIENCREDGDKLHTAIEALTQEVRDQCSIIRDFTLPSSYLTKAIPCDETDCQKSVVVPKSSKRCRPKTITARAKREKDRERKRLKRGAIPSLTSAETLTNIDDCEVTESRWQKMYSVNLNYRDRKKDYSKQKYHSDVSHQSAKKDYGRKKYHSDVSH
jgi:hypothetical protein